MSNLKKKQIIVNVQENGWIRLTNGPMIGRLHTDIDFNKLEDCDGLYSKADFEAKIERKDEEYRTKLKKIISLNNWFTAHLISAYKNTDRETKNHIDGLYLEFNSRWKALQNKDGE
jgi:hypothetical protein